MNKEILKYLVIIIVILGVFNAQGYFFKARNPEAVLNEKMKKIMLQAVSCKPHPRQISYQENEFIAFIHFGVNTYTGREWGTGFEDPTIFNPEHLDTDQWCKAIKDAGMKMVIFSTKHHDGFCLWQTRYTDQSVSKSPWENGTGDVVKELATSCKKFGLKLGIYLSPAGLSLGPCRLKLR